MISLFEHSKDDQEHGTGWPSLKTPNKGSGAKSQKKKSISKISKADFKLIKVLLYFHKFQNFYSVNLLWKRSTWF